MSPDDRLLPRHDYERMMGASMEAARSIEHFVASPIGHYICGRTYLAWCASSDLAGNVFWGCSSDEDVAEVCRALDYDLALPGPFDLVTDAMRLTGIDPTAFERLIAYVAGRRGEYERRLRKQIMVRPAGFLGAAVAGFNAMAGSGFPWQVTENAEEAFSCLGRPDAPKVHKQIAVLIDEVASVDISITTLRALLERAPSSEITVAARELGVSVRVLQRRLEALGTNFRSLAVEARLAAARRLIESSDEKLDVIARRVGLASASQLSRLFRRHENTSPKSLRKRT